MSVSTYGELSNLIVQRLARSVASPRIAEFVQLGEVLLNRRLRLSGMQAATGVSIAAGTDVAAVPAGFLAAQRLILADGGELLPVSLDSMNFRPLTGRPLAFTVTGDAGLQFDIKADQDYAGTLRYYKRQTLNPDDSNSTNWLLVNGPDCYLYAALISAHDAFKNPTGVASATEFLDAAVRSIEDADKKQRNESNDILSCDTALCGVRGSFFGG